MPKIFVPNDPQNPLLDVSLEVYDEFSIYWFHWTKDASFTTEDYEPIIIIYSGERLCYLITRAHWQYKDYYPEAGLEMPPEIIFQDPYHNPLPNTRYNIMYEALREGLKFTVYEVKPVEPHQIPRKFRTGSGHPSNIWNVEIDDPASVARVYHRIACADKL